MRGRWSPSACNHGWKEPELQRRSQRRSQWRSAEIAVEIGGDRSGDRGTAGPARSEMVGDRSGDRRRSQRRSRHRGPGALRDDSTDRGADGEGEEAEGLHRAEQLVRCMFRCMFGCMRIGRAEGGRGRARACIVPSSSPDRCGYLPTTSIWYASVAGPVTCHQELIRKPSGQLPTTSHRGSEARRPSHRACGGADPELMCQ